jgi:hypothetical protein
MRDLEKTEDRREEQESALNSPILALEHSDGLQEKEI